MHNALHTMGFTKDINGLYVTFREALMGLQMSFPEALHGLRGKKICRTQCTMHNAMCMRSALRSVRYAAFALRSRRIFEK